MLETTLATEFVPGTNLKGNVAGANWTFLLPSLELDLIVCVGVPPAAALTTLARLGRDVAVVCKSAQYRALSELCRRSDLLNVRPIAAGAQAVLPLAERSVDLIVLGAGAGHQALPAELVRLLKPDGVVYYVAGAGSHGPIDGLGAPQHFWVTPLRGEMQTAVPANDPQTINYFIRHALYSPSVKLRPFKRAERAINRRLARLGRRQSALVGRPETGLDERPPRYLRAIAQDAGVDIGAYRWGLAAHGEYTSRKVLFFLFAGAGSAPAYIVKMTREPALNRRLENEQRALTLLHEHGLGDSEVLPRAAFFGHHGGLAVVGETIVAGAPFRQRTDGTAECRYLHAAVDWLTELAAATADRGAASPLQVAEGLETLLGRFSEIYQLAPAHHAFLADLLGRIAGSRVAFPLVFQHGDPGTWNMLATPAGRAAFLDWEAFERHGMPLWDLFYFMRSYGVWSSRMAGVRDSLKGFERQFMADSALGAYLVSAAGRYCARGGLAPELVESLFYTCWMHRALKEATRLPAEQLERGHYVGLLRLCIDGRDAPTLRKLFSKG
ncbi:MAG: phosphotransferase [Roseiflexaceae bacterium]